MSLIAALLAKGVPLAPVMAFLVAGGVSSTPAAIAVFAFAKIQAFVLYLSFAFSGSLTAGLFFHVVQ